MIDARPDILNHNTETVPRLYRTVRPGRALRTLARAAPPLEGTRASLTKSGIMVGLGEEWDEVLEHDPPPSATRAPTS